MYDPAPVFTHRLTTNVAPSILESLIEGWVSLCGKEGIRLGITSDQRANRFS